MPQPPQFNALVLVLTQLPLQFTVPLGHEPAHWPAEHTGVVPVQGVAVQLPQWLASEVRSTQVPLQSVSPVWHLQEPA